MRDNPADDDNALLESLGGLGVELTWDRGFDSAVPDRAGGLTSRVGSAVRRRNRVRDRRERPRPSRPGGEAAEIAPVCVYLLLTRRQGHRWAPEGPSARTRYRRLPRCDGMAPGERITGLIRRSIADCDVVLSIISSRSLTSAWVASETIKAMLTDV
jgi:hypothetical protein